MGFVLITKNKEADRSDGTHAQLLPHIKNVKSAMVKHAQEDPSEANEFIELEKNNEVEKLIKSLKYNKKTLRNPERFLFL